MSPAETEVMAFPFCFGVLRKKMSDVRARTRDSLGTDCTLSSHLEVVGRQLGLIMCFYYCYHQSFIIYVAIVYCLLFLYGNRILVDFHFSSSLSPKIPALLQGIAKKNPQKGEQK